MNWILQPKELNFQGLAMSRYQYYTHIEAVELIIEEELGQLRNVVPLRVEEAERTITNSWPEISGKLRDVYVLIFVKERLKDI